MRGIKNNVSIADKSSIRQCVQAVWASGNGVKQSRKFNCCQFGVVGVCGRRRGCPG